MSRPVLTIGPDAGIDQAMDLMLRQRVAAIPVVDAAGAILGIVADVDLIRNELDAGARCTTVDEIMTAPLSALPSGAGLQAIAAELVDHHRSCIPIVEGLQLVGSVSRLDLLAALAARRGIRRRPWIFSRLRRDRSPYR